MSDQEIFRQRGAYLVPDVAPCVTDHWAKGTGGPAGGGNTPIVVFTQNDAGRDASIDVAPTLRSGHGGGAVNQCVCLPVDIRNAIRQSDNDVTGKGWGDVGDPMYTLTVGGKTPGVCCIQGDIAAGRRGAQHGMGVCEDVSFSLLTSSPHCVAYNSCAA